MLKKGDRVRVRGGEGVAVIVKFIRSFGVYLLDRRMTIRYPGGPAAVDWLVSYWTFSEDRLEKVEE